MNASVDAIFNIIIKQTPDGYRKCLQQLRQLHKDNVFDTEHVVDKLITDIFAQLSQPEESAGNNFPLNR
ncbi:MAG: hypothetical protein K0S11_32 [Gammaproteobacteria bacterium]|jgi:hypothetical protein|nr:hypothetical protein [Gammaproteobacteria bacterium]